MLSIKNKFLYVHLPKTGGNSVQNVLSQYSEDRIVCVNDIQDGVERFEVRNNFESIHKHSSLIEYSKFIKLEELNNLYKFTTVRNPWERMISYYFSPHRKCEVWDRREFISLVKQAKSLPDMIWADKSKPWYSNVDLIMKFERLEEDFKLVCDQLNISCSQLHKRNQSKRSHYQTYYDDELVELVAEKFKDEIEFGQYQF